MEVDIIDSVCVLKGKKPKLIKNKIDEYIRKINLLLIITL